MIIAKSMIVFLLGVFAFGGMFMLGNYVIEALTANLPMYYPDTLAIINYTLSLMIAGSVILFGFKKANITAPGGFKY